MKYKSKHIIWIFLAAAIIISISFVSGCSYLYGEFEGYYLYLEGQYTGDVAAIYRGMNDIRIDIYELPDTQTVQGTIQNTGNVVTNEFSTAFSQGMSFEEDRTVSYLLVPRVDSYYRIPSSAEVTFIPESRIATYEYGVNHTETLTGYDFDTEISFPH